MGGGIEGAERLSRETATWTPSMRSPDAAINMVKATADARSRDMAQNDGFTSGAVATHKDSIVGSQFRLNAQPKWQVIGAPEGWHEEFTDVVEARFNLIAESDSCWLDASRRNTFTSLIRLAVGGFCATGEVLGQAQWIRESLRPIHTAIQMLSPDRMTNPNGVADDDFLRRGVNRDFRGKPLGYWIQQTHPNMGVILSAKGMKWDYVEASLPWGRRQMIHIIEQMSPDQTRGIADMVAALKTMKMTKQFKDIVLQNAVINASYAAAIESEIPEVAYQTMGAGGYQDVIGQYMGALGSYLEGSKNIQIDGAKIPHLFPGTKLTMQPMGTPGGVGTGFEESLLRHTAASLGLSYEEFSRDFTKTNYSSARASMGLQWKFMQSRKKIVADRLATSVYALVLEEMIAAGDVPLPRGMARSKFYEPLMKEAFTSCSWIGASRGQIDELKETQAAILRINSGLSTYETESGRLGTDYRTIFAQRAREKKLAETLGLDFNMSAAKSLNAKDDKNADSSAAEQPKEDADE